MMLTILPVYQKLLLLIIYFYGFPYLLNLTNNLHHLWVFFKDIRFWFVNLTYFLISDSLFSHLVFLKFSMDTWILHVYGTWCDHWICIFIVSWWQMYENWHFYSFNHLFIFVGILPAACFCFFMKHIFVVKCFRPTVL